MKESIEQVIEIYKYLGKHPARAARAAKKQGFITHGMSREYIARQYKNNADTLEQSIKYLKERNIP